jgi:hypothetical protein
MEALRAPFGRRARAQLAGKALGDVLGLAGRDPLGQGLECGARHALGLLSETAAPSVTTSMKLR